VIARLTTPCRGAVAARAALTPPDDEGAADPLASHRDSACLFYADAVTAEDRWCDERTSRVWIQGDLPAEDVGTQLGGGGSRDALQRDHPVSGSAAR
jgi:hypothetical protein